MPAATELAEGEGNTNFTVTATLDSTRTEETVIKLSFGGAAKSTDYKVVSAPDITIAAGSMTGTANLTLAAVDDNYFEGAETLSINGAASGVEVTGLDISIADNNTAPELDVSTTPSIISIEEGQSADILITVRLVGGSRFEESQKAGFYWASDNAIELPGDGAFTPNNPPWTLTIPQGAVSASMRVSFNAREDHRRESLEPAKLVAGIDFAGTTISGSFQIFSIRDVNLTESFALRCNATPQYPGTTSASCYVTRTGPAVARTYTVTMTAETSDLVKPKVISFSVSGTTATSRSDAQDVEFVVDERAAGKILTWNLSIKPEAEDAILRSFSTSIWPQASKKFEISDFSVSTNLTRRIYTRGSNAAQITFSTRRPVKILGPPRIEIVLDSGVVSAPCSTFHTAALIACRYYVQEGDYDFDGQIELRAGAVKFTGWQDRHDPKISGKVKSPLPAADKTYEAPLIYGGDRAIDLSVSPQSLQEGTGEQQLTITAQDRVGMATDRDLVIPLTFTDITTSPDDYIVSGTLSVTIPKGKVDSQTTSVSITPRGDLLKEDRVERLRIDGTQGAMMTPFVRGAELSILDSAGIALSVSPAEVSENGGAQEVMVTAEWGDKSDSVLPTDTKVDLSWGGTAGAGDYTRTGGGAVTIPKNSRSGTTKVTITPADDKLLEGDETILIGGSAPGRTVSETELKLTDDEVAPDVSLAVDRNSLNEGGGSGLLTVSATIDDETVVRTETATVTLDLGGTAAEGTDYSVHWARDPPVISISADATSGTITLTVTPVDDNLAEDDETIVVEGAATIGSRNLVVKVATVTLKDDDILGVNVSPKALTIAEGEKGQYEVWLGTQPTAEVTVSLSSSDAGTATVNAAALKFSTSNWDIKQMVEVTGVDDDRNNDNDQRTAEVRHKASGGDYEGVAVEPVEVTVTDDDEATSFSIGGASATEGQAISFTVTRSGATGDAASVDWSTAEDSDGDHPASSSDYTEQATAQTLNFAAGETSKTITVQTTDDVLDEEDETFLVELSSPSAGASISDATATGTITDDDMSGLSIGDVRAAEGEDAEFTVSLSTPSSRDVTVTATTSEGTATAPEDYTHKTEALTITAGTTSATFSVSIAAGTQNEIDETFTVTLSGATGATIDDDTATGTITGNANTLISIADATVDEGGSATVTISRLGHVAGASHVRWNTADNTADGASAATAETDYRSRTNRKATFEAGETSIEITIKTSGDTLDEDDETFLVVLSQPGGGALLDDATAIVTIKDDDPEPKLSVAGASAEEGSGVIFTISLDPVSGRDVTVQWATAADVDGTNPATADDDYTAVGAAQTVTIAAGQTKAAVTVDTAADDVDEPNETFLVELSSPGNATLVSAAATATGTITDDDTRGVTVTPASLTLAEADDTDTNDEEHKGAYTVALDSEPTGTVTVSVASGDTGIATVGSSSLEFTPSDWDAQTVTVTAVADAEDNAGDKRSTAIAHTVSAAGTDYDGVAASSVTVNVTDDDGEPTLSVDAPSVGEGDSGTAALTFTVTLSPASGKPVSVAYADAATGSATSATDYAAITAGTLNFAAGDTSKTVEVAVNGDTLDESNETVKLRLSSPANAGFAGDATAIEATGTIIDDDVPELSVTAGAAVAEGTAASFTVSADIAPAAALTVNLDVDTTAGFAAAGTTGSQTLTFPAGQTSASYTVNTAGDATDEPDGSVTVDLKAGTGYTVASDSGTATVAVNDDDRTTVTLGRAGTGGIAENGGSVEVTVTLGRALVAGESVTVPLTVTGPTVTTHYTLALKTPSGGTGVTFSDSAPHSPQNPAVTLAGAGAQTATLVLTAVANTDEESRAVSIGYGTGDRAPASAGLSGGIETGGSPLSVPIIDDDAMVGVAAASAAEGSAVAFAVTLPKPAPSGGVTIGYSTSDGRGVSTDASYQVATSADYTAAANGATLTIPQGDSSGTISIATTQDATYEGDHHFTLTLTSTSHFNLGAATATGTIEDDADAPAFAFTAASTDADEDGGTVTLTISKTGTTLLGATVSYATKDGTATGGSDFTAIAATSLAFAATDTSKDITVTITDDNADEPAEAFTVELSNPSDAQLGATKSHSITITDNDKTAVTLSAPSGDIAESGGSKVITVTLGRALSGDETLAVPLTFGGAATFGADYALAAPNPAPTGVTYANLASTDLTTSPPTITFSGVAGSASSATVTLSASADTTDEGASESVTVDIGTIATAPDGGASATGAAAFNITDDDNAPGGIALTVDADTSTAGAQSSVTEDGGAKTARVTATLAGSTTFDAATEVTVTVGKAGDAAVSDTDYTAVSPFKITIPAKSSSASADFTLTPTNDALDEDDEALSLTGAAGTLTVAGTTITIDDDDALPALSIADASAVTEGGQASFKITLTPASGRDVTVKWATAADADGTNPATAGEDYTAVAATTATIAAGSAAATVTVDTLADVRVETDETFLVRLSEPVNATLSPTASEATGTITDNAVPTLDITGVPSKINDRTPFTSAFTFSEDVTGFVPGDVTVTGATKGDFAGSGKSYTLVLVPEGSRNVVVTVPADAATDGVNTTPATDVTRTAAWDAAAPSVTIGDASAAEGGAMTFTVTLDRAVPGGLTVTPDFTDGTAAKGVDYTENTTALTFAGTAGETQTFTVATTEDDLAEGQETFTVGLTVSGTAVTVTAADTATGTIDDDDQPPDSITLTVDADTQTSGMQSSVAEDGGAKTVQVTATIDGPARFAGDKTLTVDVGSQGDSAISGTDYAAVPDFDLVLAAGQASVSGTFTLTPVDDDESEADEAISLNGEMTDMTVTPARITVTDDDGVTTVTVFSLNALVLSETALAMTEGAGTSYAVSLATQPADTVTVEITGHAGTDLSLDRTSLTFGTSDWDAPQTVTVSAARDADEDEDTATLVHTATGGGYDGIAAELPVTVRDGIKISLEAGKAVEGSFMEVRFTLSSPSPGDVEVSWLTHPGGGSAHGGPRDDPDDFRMESGRLHFAAGETEIVREVWIVEDGIDDPHEQFTVQIDRPRGAVLADPVTSMPSLARPDRRIELGREIAYAVVTILQAEAAPEPVEVTLEAAPPTLEEGGRTLLWARLAEPLPEPVRIPLVWTERTAEPEDHDGPGGLTIYAGDLRGRATLNAFEDNDEDDETLSVSFGELPQWVVAGTPDPVEIAILDNDGGGGDFAGLTVSVADATVREGEANLRFPVTLSRPAPGPVTVYARIDPNAGTARRGADYVDTAQRVRFEAGDRLKFVTVLVEDDLIDEGEETLYLELSDAEPNGVTIARARATGTIRNTDPMPAAWLARFGRTVAEQALDGVAARIGASREPGWRGSLGGLPLGGGPSHGEPSRGEPPRGGPPGGEETGAPKGPGGLSRLGGIADDPFGQRPGGFGQGALSGHGAAPGTGVPGGHGAPGACGAMGGVEPSGGPRHDAPPTRPGPSCAGPGGHGLAALTGTDFSLTGKPDASGGTLAFWGRGARTTFGGREGPVNIDGEVSTGLLGADYARDRWLVGLALAHSLGDGAFAGPEIGSGEVASSLTAAIPYASLEASERLSLWGAAGYGAGEVTLEGGGVPAFAAGIDWAMAAAGARGGLFAPKDGHGGPALNVIADALWSRAGSEKTSDMVATASDVTRLRVGLEGSWPLRLPGGVELKPRLETGLRHDGGDAETGFGVELGGGLVWTDPRIGLSVDIAARTLLAHEAQGRTDRGLSASIAFDPDPSSGRGLSLSLKQDLGGDASGGLNALFAHEAPGRGGALGGDARRWTAEAAYGLPAFGDRFTGTPHFGYGHAGTGRDYRLGWRLEPADPDALQLTFGIEITRREDTAGPPEHRIGAEIGVRW
ncbi:MAG: hypothetical protein OXH14_14860 [Alphaproteobacteria bacterium]|nr:hypothetical protein [Alphaproteobacteria bacterium]